MMTTASAGAQLILSAVMPGPDAGHVVVPLGADSLGALTADVLVELAFATRPVARCAPTDEESAFAELPVALEVVASIRH